MGIGIIQNHSQYKNICGNYTYHMPAPVCQSKMKDLDDEFVLTEKMMEAIREGDVKDSAEAICVAIDIYKGDYE